MCGCARIKLMSASMSSITVCKRRKILSKWQMLNMLLSEFVVEIIAAAAVVVVVVVVVVLCWQNRTPGKQHSCCSVCWWLFTKHYDHWVKSCCSHLHFALFQHVYMLCAGGQIIIIIVTLNFCGTTSQERHYRDARCLIIDITFTMERWVLWVM